MKVGLRTLAYIKCAKKQCTFIAVPFMERRLKVEWQRKHAFKVSTDLYAISKPLPRVFNSWLAFVSFQLTEAESFGHAIHEIRYR
jgi:hypothetical protein